MEWDAFQEAIRDQYTDEELERFHNEIHRERVMIALPEMQAKANQVVNEIVKHCDETENVTVKVLPHCGVDVNDLRISITCNDFGLCQNEFQSLNENMKSVDSFWIGDGIEPDTIRISLTIKNFYHELK